MDSDLIRVPISIVAADCERLDLLLGPAVDETRGGFVTIDPFKVTIDNPDDSKRLEGALCLTSRLMSRAAIQGQAGALNPEGAT